MPGIIGAIGAIGARRRSIKTQADIAKELGINYAIMPLVPGVRALVPGIGAKKSLQLCQVWQQKG